MKAHQKCQIRIPLRILISLLLWLLLLSTSINAQDLNDNGDPLGDQDNESLLDNDNNDVDGLSGNEEDGEAPWNNDNNDSDGFNDGIPSMAPTISARPSIPALGIDGDGIPSLSPTSGGGDDQSFMTPTAFGFDDLDGNGDGNGDGDGNDVGGDNDSDGGDASDATPSMAPSMAPSKSLYPSQSYTWPDDAENSPSVSSPQPSGADVLHVNP
ncbi:unnamed protein product, partial [Cylindrotheca closterium]